MARGFRHRLPAAIGAGLLAIGLAACSRTSERDFVGKWQSSRTQTPIHMVSNGEWEIRTEEGTILQYGVWRYEDKKLIWSFKQDNGQILDDPNPVLSVGPKEFSVRERNGTTTVFKRVD